MKKISLSIFVIFSILLLGSLGFAEGSSKYDEIKNNVAKKDKQIDLEPNGEYAQITKIKYQANSQKDKNSFKKFDEINGYVSDKEIKDKGGTYTRKELMTYKEFVDLGIDESLRYDIDPERVVWVFTSKFNKTHNVYGKMIEKAIVTTVYDAETGNPLILHVSSEDPYGLNELKRN